MDEWQDQALCASSPDAIKELFFATTNNETWEARLICLQCPVIEACRETALRRGERLGVWGGMTAKERATATTRKHSNV